MDQARHKITDEFLVASQIGHDLGIAPCVGSGHGPVDDFEFLRNLILQGISVRLFCGLELLLQLLELGTMSPNEFAVCCHGCTNFSAGRLWIFQVHDTKRIPFGSIGLVLGARLAPFLLFSSA